MPASCRRSRTWRYASTKARSESSRPSSGFTSSSGSSSDGGELLLDHDVGDLVGRRGEALRTLADLVDRVVDLQRSLARGLRVVAADFLRDVDEPAGVDRVVGRVQDAARVQIVAVARLGELVVRGAGDDLRAQVGHGVVVEAGAERA